MFYSPSKQSFYDKKIHGSLMPEDVIEIAFEDYQVLLSGQSMGKLITPDQYGRPTLSDPERQTIDKRKKAAKNSVDRSAGDARLRFVSPGYLVEQEYREAETAAREWQNAGEPASSVPPEVQVWADASNMTPSAAASDIIQTGQAWRDVLSQVRALRLQGKAAIDAAADADIEPTAQIYIDQLDAMAPQ